MFRGTEGKEEMSKHPLERENPRSGDVTNAGLNERTKRLLGQVVVWRRYEQAKCLWEKRGMFRGWNKLTKDLLRVVTGVEEVRDKWTEVLVKDESVMVVQGVRYMDKKPKRLLKVVVGIDRHK